jgi:hypothetical protein
MATSDESEIIVYSNENADYDLCPSCFRSAPAKTLAKKKLVPLTTLKDRGHSSVQCDKCERRIRDKPSSRSTAEDDEGDGEGPSRTHPCLVFSAHGDTCFDVTSCRILPKSEGQLYFGHMDNFAGVHAMMNAYFSGRLPSGKVLCQITYGEEDETEDGEDFVGARELMESLLPTDVVVVIDVTGVCSRRVCEETVVHAKDVVGHVVIEKIKHNERMVAFMAAAMGPPICVDGVATGLAPTRDYTYEYWNECNDPQADEDETDAYRDNHRHVFFLGLPTCGGSFEETRSHGDYNSEEVYCWRRDIDAVTKVVVDLSIAFDSSPHLLYSEAGELLD